ncbi:RHS repeat-associated core domain-containing protein [Polyangium sp. 15x6]|uniref:RHS repeat-associated core domain-containing protein n=1 Tax=Polyangium sp. 15x6 TaxID=3042687 RepID=UPI00249C38C4|nr:RHS repeat-associated core domain-containing protein [Polyangium sp. 15x6]MDI3288314.1 RHS repeat-associated core domain-containing protein [Polyangium sp. 15x6]
MPTSPAPDAAAPPGMCPGVVVLGGGGGAGGGDGDGSGGKDGSGGSGSGSGEGGAGDGKDARGAPDYQKYPECGYASHPVDVVTGRAFTHPITDLELPGPLPLAFQRMYSSKMAARDAGLGYGWGHTFGWEIEVGRRRITVWNEQGIAVDFPMIEAGREVIGPWGWLLRREQEGFSLDADDGVWRRFSPASAGSKRHRLAAIEDRNHNRIALTYRDGALVEIVDSAGRTLRVHTTPEGRIASLEVKNALVGGRWVAFATYTYDEHGDLIAARDADGFASRYAYDDEHRLTADTDRTGLTFHFVYDHEGRCIESWGDYPGKRDPSLCDGLPERLADDKTRAKGIHHCRFDYQPGGYSEVADSTQVRRFFGNEHGTLDKRVEGSAVTTATYRADGHIVSRTDPLGATTVFERDARGRLLGVKDPLGRVTALERDGNGLPIAVTDPAGGVTRIERDPRGNVLLVTDAAGGVSSYRHDDRGLLTEAVSPTGARTQYAYDAQGNLVAATMANGGVFRFVYDALGRRLSYTDPLGAETRYAYSERGDLVMVRDAAGGVTRYGYDGEGHLTRVVEPKGHVIELVWGGYHKLCQRTDANGNVVRLRYNLEGELVEVHNERGEVHRLTYSTSGLLTGETTFDGRVLRYRSDLGGRVVKIENGAREVTGMEYDLAGKLVKRSLHDGSVEEYAYDLLGNLVAVTGPAGEFRFARDALGQVVREAQVVGGKEHWVESLFDGEGERIGRKTSLGHTEAVTRGALGERARTVLDGGQVVEHQADILGRETARALSGGGWLQSQYDAMGRVIRRRAGGAVVEPWGRAGEPEWLGARPEGLTVDTAYRYDESGELLESWDRAKGPTRYEYDPVGQLLAMVPEKARAELFRYDTAGNLHEAGEGAGERVYGRGNRLLRKGDTEYRWDDDGRLVEKRWRDGTSGREELWRYAWNGAGLLQEVERPDGLRVEFGYDPFARRVSKRVTRAGALRRERVAVSETRFVWDGEVLVHEIEARAQAGGDPVVEERTYWFEDDGFAPVAHKERRHDDVGRERGGWFHYVNDPIGTPERLIGSDGAVACELRRSAWGETEEAPGGKASTRIRFQGQYEDEETGLRYNRFRYYDAGSGRFVSADPIGLLGGFNGHAYVPSPITDIDPLGLKKSRSIRNAQQELRDLGALSGRSRSDIEKELKSRGYRSCAAESGGTVWTKKMSKGQTAVVRLDPAEQRDPPRGFADEVPHAHKEIIATAAVNNRGNFKRRATKLNDSATKTDDPRQTHIPILWDT